MELYHVNFRRYKEAMVMYTLEMDSKGVLFTNVLLRLLS